MPPLTPCGDADATSHLPLVPAPRAPLPASPCNPADAWDLVLPHQARLLALACACGATPDTARDVVQEALLRTATRPGLDPDHLTRYLTVVVRRLAVDLHRANQRQHQLTRHRALEPLPQPGPDEHVCQQAEATWLHQQTQRLRPRERQALTLHSAGATTSQIAAGLGTTSKAAEHLLHRARTTLKLLLAATLAIAAGTCTLTLTLTGTSAAPHQLHRPAANTRRDTTATPPPLIAQPALPRDA